MMNHDATHCLDYCKDCPKTCYRRSSQRNCNGGLIGCLHHGPT